MKYTKRIIIFVIMTIMCWSLWSTFQVGVEPVISTDLALNQLNNTTEAHVLNRTYNEGVRKDVKNPVYPTVFSIALFAILFYNPIMSVINKKESE